MAFPLPRRPPLTARLDSLVRSRTERIAHVTRTIGSVDGHCAWLRSQQGSSRFDAALVVRPSRKQVGEARRALVQGGRIVLTGPDWDTFVIDNGDPAPTRSEEEPSCLPRPRRAEARALIQHAVDPGCGRGGPGP